jgi:hypothetical protein
MVYRRKGSGKPQNTEEPSRSEELSRNDEPPSTRRPDREPGGKTGAGPRTANARCSVCGHHAEIVELPGRSEKYCFECSADVATSLLLTTEIDAATLAGQDAAPLIVEFAQLSTRLLARVQLR